MRNFYRIADQVDTVPLLQQINLHPELWNQQGWRTNYEGTPHEDVDDIWLRYAEEKKLEDLANVDPVLQDLTPVWYPAADKLWQAKMLALNIMRRVDGYQLGRLLITRIPAGGRILPHRDAEGAYTATQGGARYHLALQGLPGSIFRADSEQVCMQTGEVWWFNHLAEHEVVNNSADDRIHLIVDVISC